MSMWAILPVKPIMNGKTRLSVVLSPEERSILISTMLGNTLNVLVQTHGIDQVLVISRDPDVMSISDCFEVFKVWEETGSNLNKALELAVSVARSEMAESVIILPADIPLLQPKILEDLINRLNNGKQMVITPDRHDRGTNMLLLSPPDAIVPEFGQDSFNKHLKQARAKRLEIEIARIPELGLDLDIPEDLGLLSNQYIMMP